MKQLKAPVILTMLVVLLAALALSGCTSPTPTAAPTAAPTATPVPTVTPAPTPAADVATPTPAPTAAPTQMAATPTPYPWGQWINNIPQNVVKLTIGGKVDSPASFTMAEIKAYPSHFSSWTSGDGKQVFNGTSVYVTDLLKLVGVQSGATTIKFACTNPSLSPISTQTTLADLYGNNNTISVAYNYGHLAKTGVYTVATDESLQLIWPGIGAGGKNQVSYIDTITIA
jgi:DMSO/TMAO reductase YedYZ molybdopterin-dependent catalytic subunit